MRAPVVVGYRSSPLTYSINKTPKCVLAYDASHSNLEERQVAPPASLDRSEDRRAETSRKRGASRRLHAPARRCFLVER
jgi:hypothetical protein